MRKSFIIILACCAALLSSCTKYTSAPEHRLFGDVDGLALNMKTMFEDNSIDGIRDEWVRGSSDLGEFGAGRIVIIDYVKGNREEEYAYCYEDPTGRRVQVINPYDRKTLTDLGYPTTKFPVYGIDVDGYIYYNYTGLIALLAVTFGVVFFFVARN